MARLNYLGLNMDVLMVPKIVTALRGLYPSLVSPADSDNRVVQICLQHIITEHLAAWAARSAIAAPVDQLVRQVQRDADTQQKAAEDGARTDAADIIPTALA